MGNSIERLNRRVPRKSLAQPLVVDPECHRAELARFCRHIVVGPDVDDCAIWVGAIGDDGYGRFHVSRNATARFESFVPTVTPSPRHSVVCRWNRTSCAYTLVTIRSACGSRMRQRCIDMGGCYT